MTRLVLAFILALHAATSGTPIPAEQTAGLGPSVILRKMHLVRPDLIGIPNRVEVVC